MEKVKVRAAGFEVISCETEVEIWVEKVLSAVEVEGIIVDRAALKSRAKADVEDVFSGAVVTPGFLRGGDLLVDMSQGLAGVEVRVSAGGAADCVKACRPTVAVFGTSSKSASRKWKESHQLAMKLKTHLFVNN